MITIKDSENKRTIEAQCCVYVAQLDDATAIGVHINNARIDEAVALVMGLDELKEKMLNRNPLVKEFYNLFKMVHEKKEKILSSNASTEEFYNLLKKIDEEKEKAESYSSLLKDFGVIDDDNNK